MEKFDLGEELLKQDVTHNGRYFLDEENYLCRWKQTKDGYIPVRLCNFDARIFEELTEDNGLDLTHVYNIAGITSGKKLPVVSIPASQFYSLNWIHAWGNDVIIEPGMSNKDYVRHAIQIRSTDIVKRTVYTHTGWRFINEKWVYLSATGAIGDGKVLVKLSRELQRYSLPLQPENEDEACKASLSFLDMGKPEITFPLFAGVYLTPLTTLLKPFPNFSFFLYGETGALKSTIAKDFVLSHFGEFDSISNLSNFDDTGNALEKRAFILKDMPQVLDDFAPSIKKIDSQHKEQLAQRIIRAYSNRTGRGRLNSDTTEKGRYEPRGMLFVTGEELVTLQSTLARLLILEFSAGDIKIETLTEFQKRVNLLPHAMSSFITYIKEYVSEIQETFNGQFKALRSKASNESVHKKLPEQVAFLQFALETAFSWMVDKEILSAASAKELADKGWNVFLELAEKQAQRIEREDPVSRFIEILQTLISQGKVRVEHKNSTEQYEMLGGSNGELIGYHDENFFYLLPTALWHAIQQFCIKEGSYFPASRNTFYRLLKNRNLIIPGEDYTTYPERFRDKIVRVLKFYRGGILEISVTTVTGGQDA